MVNRTIHLGKTPVGGAAATWDPANAGSSITFANGNLDARKAGNISGYTSVIATVGKGTGKRYFEIKYSLVTVATGGGIADSAITLSDILSASGQSLSFINGALGVHGTWTNISLTPTVASGDILGFAIDLDAGNVWMAKNNNYTVFRAGADPASGANPNFTYTPPFTFFPATSFYGVGTTPADDMSQTLAASGTSLNGYSPPSGFVWWNA